MFDFVQGLLEQEEGQQAVCRIRIGRPQPLIGHGLVVGGEKCGRRPVAPLAKRRAELAVLIVGHFERALKGCGCRIIDRSDQAGDVARRGRLAPAFGDTAPRRAFEVDDEDVVLDDQQLS